MGGMQAKEKCIITSSVEMERLKNKVKILQEEIEEIMCVRDVENRAYERELMVFGSKEVEWKKEKKKLKEEIKKLKKKMEDNSVVNEGVMGNNEGKMMEINNYCYYKGGEVQINNSTRRDEAVEKWKQLYFAIKTELDDLIQRTYDQGGMLWNKAEEEETTMVEKLKKELMKKEAKIKNLKEEITEIKKQEYKHERELDILRQSLRIMCFNRKQQQEAIRVTSKNTKKHS